MIDFNSKLGRAAKKLLDSEFVIWLTTVGSDLTPQPRPVWFIWDEDAVLIFSQPAAAKPKHIRQHARVSLHFNTDREGDENIIILTGEATLPANATPASAVPAYVKKYKSGMAELDMTPESFSESYSRAIRIAPGKIRGG